jgi:integrase
MHTAASLILSHDTPMLMVARVLGHSRPSITLDIYGYLIPEMQNEVADLMDELVTPNQIELHTPHTNPSFPLINELLSFKHGGQPFG